MTKLFVGEDDVGASEESSGKLVRMPSSSGASSRPGRFRPALVTATTDGPRL